MKVAATFLALGACALSSANATVTYHRDVAPILYAKCAPCHRPGEAGPFSLLSFEDARRHGKQIGEVTLSGYMPPWLPKRGVGNFAGEMRLSAAEKKIVADWLAGGMMEGDQASGPRAPQFTPGWQLGPPDLVLNVPAAYHLATSGDDVFRNFVVPVHLDHTVYVRAIELRPGDRKLVHHANVVLDRAHTLRNRDGKDGQPGFPGMDVATESGDAFDPDSHFLFWKPGSPPEEEPADMGWRLDPNTDLILNLHLQPSGKPEEVKPSIGIYFAKQPPTRFPMLIQLEHDGAIDIPAGASQFEISDRITLPVAVDVLRIYPHAHYLGKRIDAWARLPSGRRISLIEIDDWDLKWQAVFTYREPVHLPRGTVVEMRIVYDNSATNVRNPDQPPRRVRTGNSSRDEMGHVWIQVLPEASGKSDPRMALQESVMKRRIEKEPLDLTAHYNLGALDLAEERYPDALREFEAALKTEPGYAPARNSMGVALLHLNRTADAIKAWRETPDYPQAHFNLARSFAADGNGDGAIAEYTTYLRLEPDDVPALLQLGGVYIAVQRLAEAIPVFERAAKLAPDSDTYTNLGTLLARTARFDEARKAFEEALRLSPSNEVARKNLQRLPK